MEVVAFFLTKKENNIIYMYRESIQYFYWKKGTHESLDVVCTHFNVKKRTIVVYYIYMGYSEWCYDVKKIDHCFDSFEKYHQKCIIMPTEPFNFSIPEESIYIAIKTPPGFIKNKISFQCNHKIIMLKCSFGEFDNED